MKCPMACCSVHHWQQAAQGARPSHCSREHNDAHLPMRATSNQVRSRDVKCMRFILVLWWLLLHNCIRKSCVLESLIRSRIDALSFVCLFVCLLNSLVHSLALVSH
jgi:hypothetical protein